MTQQEFEQLTGSKTTEKEYSYIEMAYMSDDYQSKQEFCDTWKSSPKPARDLLIKMAHNQEELKVALKASMSRTSSVYEELLNIMFKRAQKMADPVLREACISHMGVKSYLYKLLEGNYSLWEDDKKLILKIIK